MSDLNLFIDWLRDSLSPAAFQEIVVKANEDYSDMVAVCLQNPDAMPTQTELVLEAVVHSVRQAA